MGERIYTWQCGRGAKKLGAWTNRRTNEFGIIPGGIERWNRHQDQIRKRHDPVDTAPMPKIVESSDQNTLVPSATATLPELPSADEVPSLSPQRPDSTEHSHPQAPVVEEAPTTRRYPARDRRPPHRLTYDS